MLRSLAVLLVWCCVLAAVAVDVLPPGLHKNLTSPDGKYRFSVLVPAALAVGSGTPVLVALPGYSGPRDPSPWKPWADRRSCVVVALEDGLARTGPKDSNPYDHIPAVLAHYAASLKAVENMLPLHPFFRVAVSDHSSSQMCASFAKAQGDRLGAMLMTRPFSFQAPYTKEIPKHVGVFVLLGEQDVGMQSMFEATRDRLREVGLMVRSATVIGGNGNAEVPQFGCDTAADHLLDYVVVTHPSVSAKDKVKNQQAVLTRGEALIALPDVSAHEQLTWLLSLPEFDKTLKPHVWPLANRWMDAGIALAKAKEAEDLVQAHEDLSLVSKRPQARLVDPAHTKAIATELKRMRKDPKIKLEIVAADALADTVAMLDDDFTIAKQKIALKQLEELVAKHPSTHAGKVAAKLLEPLRRNLR